MALLFDSVVIPEVAVQDSDLRFPVRRIYCVGQNYRDHVKEMGGDPKSSPPVFFSKPADAIMPSGSRIAYPSATSNLHYEVELVVALKSGGSELDAHRALRCIYGYAVGIDFTRRDRQAEAKEKGRPWEIGKNFDDAGVMGVVTPKSESLVMENAAITLDVNNQQRQAGNINQMAYSTTELIAFLSTLQELKAGDLIFTGTPSGVGAVTCGDHLVGRIDGLEDLVIQLV